MTSNSSSRPATTTLETVWDWRMVHQFSSEFGNTERRFFHTGDGRNVQVTRNLQIACGCKQFFARLRGLSEDLCWHAEDAMAFVEDVGWSHLPMYIFQRDGTKVADARFLHPAKVY